MIVILNRLSFVVAYKFLLLRICVRVQICSRFDAFTIGGAVGTFRFLLRSFFNSVVVLILENDSSYFSIGLFKLKLLKWNEMSNLKIKDNTCAS